MTARGGGFCHRPVPFRTASLTDNQPMENTIMATATIGDLDLESAAKEAAGNWRDFTCFAWFREKDIESPDDWAIIYTHHRDSGLLDQSNAEAIAEAMTPFSNGDDPDVCSSPITTGRSATSTASPCGSIRGGKITDAFRTYHELSCRLADYPILDKQDYSDREYEATLENITDAAWRVGRDYDLPDGWESEVYSLAVGPRARRD